MPLLADNGHMSTPPTWEQIRNNAAEFVAEWKDEKNEQPESQTFWNDFLKIFGVNRRRVAVFEKRAIRASTGNAGRIDVFWPGVLIAEQKSFGKNKDNSAENQALDYLGDLPDHELPDYVLSSDFATMQITDLTPETGPETHAFPIVNLTTEIHRFGFIAGYRKRQFSSEVEAKASIEAAKTMGSIFEEMERNRFPKHEASKFLTRLLFLLFGDDSGLWEKNLFQDWVDNYTQTDGSDLGEKLARLFQILDQDDEKRPANLPEELKAFPYVNGGLFSERLDIPVFDKPMRDALLKACGDNWSEISPAVFGSMFQAVKDKTARRKLGEHYTTEENILKVLEPLFLDALRARRTKVWNSKTELRKLHAYLGDLRYLDPACGCGNFLIVAYREMRALELEIMVRLRELGDETQLSLDATLDLKVSLSQFNGIELEEWPAAIAEVAMFLVDHQANQRMQLSLGLAPRRLPIEISANIVVDNAIHADWTSILSPSRDVLIFGNPPFLGKGSRSAQQIKDLDLAWNGKHSKQSDYVTSWHAKTLSYFGSSHDGQWAFVTTNSIAQGEPVPSLFRPIFEAKWKILFAHRTFLWTSEEPKAASVHCVIVGFTRDSSCSPRLFEYDSGKGTPTERPAASINAYLVDGPNVLVTKRTVALSKSVGKIGTGSQPTGVGLLVEAEDYPEVASDPIAAKYLKRYMGARELVNNLPRWCLWMTDLSPADVSKSHILKQRIESVQKERTESDWDVANKAASTPHLFSFIQQPTTNFLCIPRTVSESRRYMTAAYLTPDVIISSDAFQGADPDGFFFAIVSSSMLITWQKTVGGRMRYDPRFANTLVWNTFPLPEVKATARQKIIDAGQGVLEARADHPERSLAEHYNPLAMSSSLVKAHNALDAVVDRAFGARKTCSTEIERQRILFERYVQLENESLLTVVKPKREGRK